MNTDAARRYEAVTLRISKYPQGTWNRGSSRADGVSWRIRYGL